MKNYNTKEAIQKLQPILNSLSYDEQIQLKSLVNDFGYLGAIQYLDPSIKRPELSMSGRDTVLVNKHYSILMGL